MIVEHYHDNVINLELRKIMDAERIIEKIDSDTLVLNNLSKYKGQEVEVIIIPFRNAEKRKALHKDLPLRKYGKIKTALSRSEIYDDER